jgi:hypothetical protein
MSLSEQSIAIFFWRVFDFGRQPLEAVIRDIKKYTSLKIIEAIQNNPCESRRELLLWLFKRAGHHNSNTHIINSGSNSIIRLNSI